MCLFIELENSIKMKKLLLYFSLLLFNFSFCEAQDTIVLWSGEKIQTNITKMGNKIYYYEINDPDKLVTYIKKSEVHYIHYADGHLVTWKPRDTIQRKFCLA